MLLIYKPWLPPEANERDACYSLLYTFLNYNLNQVKSTESYISELFHIISFSLFIV